MEATNKVAIITGGTAGIGYGIAEIFAKQGIQLVLSYAHDEQRAKDVETKLSMYGVKVVTIKADTGEKQSLETLFVETKKIFGKVAILVNNVGSTFPDGYDSDVWESMFHHHFMGTVHATELFLRQLGGDIGCMINISSVLGVEPLLQYKGARLEAYCCMKAAINMYTKVIANNCMGNVRVNAIAPGNTETESWKGSDPSFKQERIKGMLIHRFVAPAEIGKTALHLVENDAINGQVFVVDGGVVGKGYE